MSPPTKFHPNPDRESAADIDAAAFAWAARADRGALSAEDQGALDAWIAADSRRAGAYARAMAADAYLDRARALGPGYQPARHAASPVWTRRRLLAGAGGGVAASLVAALGVTTLWTRDRIATPKGDVRRVSLPEGSAVTLNTDTVVRPAFAKAERRIDLLRGEALFDVAHNPARPFRVFADDVRIEAIGTSFTVRRHENGDVEVVVRHGLVDVRRVGSAEGVRLAAATTSRVSGRSPIRPEILSPEAVDKSLAWREGRLDLTGLTLAEAAAEFARYSDYQIAFATADVGRLEVSGVYSVNDPEGFAKAAALSLGLEARALPTGVTLAPPTTS